MADDQSTAPTVELTEVELPPVGSTSAAVTAGPTRLVAAFDVDGTLTRRDSLLPFLLGACGLGPVLLAIARQGPATALALGGRNRHGAKERLLVALLAGRAEADVRAAGERYAEAVLTGRRWPGLRADVLARWRWHRDAGHELVIVSASPSVYLEPFGRLLGAETVLCTQLAVGTDGRLSGRIEGRNCRGAEKTRQLLAWLGEGPVHLWAYGDSAGDRELLALADTGHRVRGRRQRLPAAANPAGGPR